MRQPEDSFFKGTLKKVCFLIDEYVKRLHAESGQSEIPHVQNVTSMKQLKSMI